VRIICRQSRLSLLQAELVKQKIALVEPNAVVQIIGRSSRGDRESTVPLSALDGTDFFTEEIFAALQNEEADIAVHSLKDMSAPHFFSHPAFAIVDRDDVRDVALFNKNVLAKIKAGETLVIGTCSPRREEMAVGFLKQALPQLHGEIKIETKPIRGNVEGRLAQLHHGNYDATILATAGLNRLLKSEPTALSANSPSGGLTVASLLKDKLLMVLPLIECVPAPCQAAIVAEAHPSNQEAVALLQKINDPALLWEAIAEKKKAFEYGTGCLQKFGVTTITTKHSSHLYASGIDAKGNTFQQWTNLPALQLEEAQLFSSTDFMKDFFSYQWQKENIFIHEPVVFVANYKAVQPLGINAQLNHKTIWASGTKTWFELAKLGLWVQGSADALGFEQLLPVLEMPLLKIRPADICILTHKTAAGRWQQKGFRAVSNYELAVKKEQFIAEKIALAKTIFWSSFSQYEQFGKHAARDVIHICAGGETATLLQQAGVKPVIFPTIKSFEQWRKSLTHSPSAV
jgi:hydroxymethylbilane synthase